MEGKIRSPCCRHRWTGERWASPLDALLLASTLGNVEPLFIFFRPFYVLLFCSCWFINNLNKEWWNSLSLHKSCWPSCDDISMPSTQREKVKRRNSCHSKIWLNIQVFFYCKGKKKSFIIDSVLGAFQFQALITFPSLFFARVLCECVCLTEREGEKLLGIQDRSLRLWIRSCCKSRDKVGLLALNSSLD